MLVNKSFEEMIIKMETDNYQDFIILDWTSISSFKYLSEEFMDRYFNLLNPFILCSVQMISEKLIRKHINKIDDKALKTLSHTRISNFSYDFIFEYRQKLNMKVIQKNKKLMKSFSDYTYYTDTNLISYYYKANLDLMKAVYCHYRFSDDNNINLLNRLVSMKHKLTKQTEVQDTNFYAIDVHH